MCAAILAVTTNATHASAENVTWDSLEWAIWSSDLVVVGKVAKTELIKEDRPPVPAGWHREAVTIDVSKTIKGFASSPIEVLFVGHAQFPVSSAFPNNLDLLLFLVRLKDPNDHGAASAKVEWAEQGYEPTIVLADPNRVSTAPVITRDLRVLRKPQDIVAAAEKAAKNFAGKANPRGHLLWTSSVEDQKVSQLNPEAAVYLRVPVDGELESLGRRLCAGRLPMQQMEGVRALQYFPNRENTAILKSLAAKLEGDISGADPIWEEDGTLPRFYLNVPRLARALLQKWEAAPTSHSQPASGPLKP